MAVGVGVLEGVAVGEGVYVVVDCGGITGALVLVGGITAAGVGVEVGFILLIRPWFNPMAAADCNVGYVLDPSSLSRLTSQLAVTIITASKKSKDSIECCFTFIAKLFMICDFLASQEREILRLAAKAGLVFYLGDDAISLLVKI